MSIILEQRECLIVIFFTPFQAPHRRLDRMSSTQGLDDGVPSTSSTNMG